MVLPIFFIANAGRIIQIAVGAGTALARFVAKNPKIIGTTLSIEAMTDARQKKKEDDLDIQKIIAEITTNPKMSLQEIVANHPEIVRKIMKNI